MIRDTDRIYGEPNDPNTVLASGTLSDGALIVGAGNKAIKTLESLPGYYLLWIKNGEVQQFPIGQPNTVLGTDEDGNLVWIDRG